jgi:hypothetical protein
MKLSSEAEKKIIDTLSDEGYLNIMVERTEKNMFRVYLEHQGTEVFQVGQYQLYAGDRVCIEGAKIKLEFND